MPKPHASIFGEIENVSAGDKIAQRIENLILERQLNPGDALPPERELASQLSVGRNAVREALRTLSEKGLVRVVHGRGAFVQAPSTEGIEASLSMLLRFRQVRLSDLCDARAMLEPEIAALAAERGTDDDRQLLRKLLADVEDAVRDSAAHVDADLALHRAIAQAARHGVYEAITESVRGPVMQSMVLGTTVPNAIDASDDQHRAIVEAILDRNPNAAREAMRKHLDYISDYVRRVERADPS